MSENRATVLQWWLFNVGNTQVHVNHFSSPVRFYFRASQGHIAGSTIAGKYCED